MIMPCPICKKPYPRLKLNFSFEDDDTCACTPEMREKHDKGIPLTDDEIERTKPIHLQHRGFLRFDIENQLVSLWPYIDGIDSEPDKETT
jgi:hypothetical protein